MEKSFFLTPLIFLVCACTHLSAQSQLQFDFPRHLNFIPNCSGNPLSGKIKFETNSEKAIKIHSLKTNSDECKIEYNGLKVGAFDTIALDNSKPVYIDVMFQNIPHNQDSLFFSFETNIEKITYYQKNQIPFFFGQYVLASEELSQQDITIELTKSCLDSISVHFPSGGTDTFISLYKSRKFKKPIKELAFSIGDDKIRHLTFSRKDIGRYYGSLISCHWGTSFSLVVK